VGETEDSRLGGLAGGEGLCDLCAVEVGPDAPRFSAVQMRAAVLGGLLPPDSAGSLSRSMGISEADFEAQWVRRVMEDATDWAFCPSCVLEVERHLAKLEGEMAKRLLVEYPFEVRAGERLRRAINMVAYVLGDASLLLRVLSIGNDPKVVGWTIEAMREGMGLVIVPDLIAELEKCWLPFGPRRRKILEALEAVTGERFERRALERYRLWWVDHSGSLLFDREPKERPYPPPGVDLLEVERERDWLERMLTEALRDVYDMEVSFDRLHPDR